MEHSFVVLALRMLRTRASAPSVANHIWDQIKSHTAALQSHNICGVLHPHIYAYATVFLLPFAFCRAAVMCTQLPLMSNHP